MSEQDPKKCRALSDDKDKGNPKLADLYPKEVEFFKAKFIWSSNTKGFYTRHRYHTVYSDSDQPLHKWQPFKKHGEWQALYPGLVDSLAEKHLDFERFCQTCSLKDRLRPADSESAFWLGTMAGKRTFTDCIDLDSHDVIGWAYLPTRWHPDNTGRPPGPYDYRAIPVIRPSLRFFMQAKLVHGHFPDRIWAFSSANLGLAVWTIRNHAESTNAVYTRTENRLRRAGLVGLEHYPRPAKGADSLGKPHRRPCGMDSGLITSAGTVIDPIAQIRLFMRPPTTPAFACILDAYWAKLRQMYSLFDENGVNVGFNRMQPKEKDALIQECERIVHEVQDWASQGCEIDWDLVRRNINNTEPEPRIGTNDAQTEPACSQRFASTTDELGIGEAETAFPKYFYDVDLKAVAASGQWVQFVKFLVENGFPTEDKFSEVISALALWFGFVEWFGEDRDRIKELLTIYVSRQHNSMVSRLLAGNDQEVVSQIGRIVDHALDNENDDGKRVFAEIRQKRASGQYRTIYNFGPQILNHDQANPSSSIPNEKKLSYLICGGLTQQEHDRDSDSHWQYLPDLTPLPDEVLEQIQQAFRTAKRQLRKNRDEKYPILDAITCLFNYLIAGRSPGARRASQKLLVEMGFPGKSAERKPIFKILEKAGLLRRGGYRSKSQSRLWALDGSVVQAISQDHRSAITEETCNPY